MSYGRRKIFTDATEITRENVVEEVRKAMQIHESNLAEIDKLYNYLRGKTEILNKTKEIRPEINHKINENRAYEVFAFHKGYVFGEPIQYIRRENTFSETADDVIASDINALNGHMSNANKVSCDSKLADWIYIAGVGYRMTLPNKKWTKDSDEAPFKMYALDPRQTFVIHSNDVDERVIANVKYVSRENVGKVFGVYTEDMYYEFVENGEAAEYVNTLGMLPIVEYPADAARLGVFEIALPLLDMLNELQSNRMDDIVQTVNSILAILGAEMSKEASDKLYELKMMFLPDGTDAKYLAAPMNQADLQVLKEDIVRAIFEICGVPNRSNGGASSSDNGVAVLLRDGYTAAEARAKSTEAFFEPAEQETLKIVLRILRETSGTNLRLTDIKPHFTRRNYDNIATKSQVLIAMLNNSWIHPEVAYAACGIFPDPESAYLQGKAWHEEQASLPKPKEVEPIVDP